MTRREWSKSLHTRVLAAYVLITLIVTGSALLVFGQREFKAQLALFSAELERSSALQALQFENVLRHLHEDAQTAADAPGIKVLLRDNDSAGISPEWRSGVEEFLQTMMTSHPEYFRASVVDLVHGRELLRVEVVDAVAQVQTTTNWQQPGEIELLEAVRGGGRDIFLTPIRLDRENGRIFEPHRPTVSAVATVTDANGAPLGMFVLSIDLGKAFTTLQTGNREGAMTFLTNADGHWLVHPDASRVFGFEFGKPARWQDRFAGIEQAPGGGGTGDGVIKRDYAEASVYSVTRRILIDPADPANYITLTYAFPRAIAERLTEPDRRQLLATAIVTALIFSLAGLVLLRRMLRPLAPLTTAAKRIAAGDYRYRLPQEDTPELAPLVDALNWLGEQVESRERELQEANVALEERVASRTLQLDRARALAESRGKAKTEFLANMSHEIRTPLNAIIGYAHLLEKNSKTEQGAGFARSILGAGRTLLALINDILDLSRIEAGKLAIESEDFDLREVLDKVASIMASSARNKDIELAINPAPLRACGLRGDALRLEQVLVNLVGNAIKFTEHGHVAVDVNVVAEDIEGAKLEFVVSDTGIGISPENRQRIFEAFEQADASTARQHGGSGLGLAIVSNLVHMMGGSIELDSEPQQGSTFRVCLPFAWASARIDPGNRLADLRVLVADDNPVARDALHELVDMLGWHSVVVDSGEALVEEATRAPGQADVMLVDWKMPGTDGLKAARRIREALPEAGQPLVLMVTAHTAEDLQSNPDASVADVVLPKPVTSSMLHDAVMAALMQRGRLPPARKTVSGELHRLHGLRLLLVDDSEINREVGRGLFESEGASVTLADSGGAAISILGAEPKAFDLVLMDLQMPLMDGFEATRRIHEIPGLEQLPVVALTANVFEATRQKAREAGMRDFLAKPIDVEASVALLRGFIVATPVKSLVQDGPRRAGDRPLDVPPRSRVAQPSSQVPDVARGLKVFRTLPVYLRNLRRFIQQPEYSPEAILAGSPAEATIISHTMRSTAGYLGLNEVESCCQAFEDAVRGGEDGAAEREALVSALNRGRAAARDYIDSQDTGQNDGVAQPPS